MRHQVVLQHVVVDGSNIATEGRETPSLTQLDEAVRAFIRDYAPEILTVVVDATFPNRIDRSERHMYEDALAAGELITPPAGAIGRGDAFVLEIADRAGAVVLSNDSFQELHGQYAWLFDEGRLLGGKPVPHVGWVFMQRSPVRGPASRRAVTGAKRAEKRSAKKARAARTTAAPKKARVEKAGVEKAGVEKAGAEKAAARTTAAPKKAGVKKVAAQTKARPRKTAARKKAGMEKAAAQTKARPSKTAATKKKASTEKTTAPTTEGDTKDDAYNEPLPFDRFVRAQPIGGGVEGIVERFGSHGAHVLCGDVRAYVPLKNLADPPPRSARDVLKLGETRSFVVAAIDHAKRGVDLAIPGVRISPAG